MMASTRLKKSAMDPRQERTESHSISNAWKLSDLSVDFLPESAVWAAHPLHREHVPRFMLILRRRSGNCKASKCHESSGRRVGLETKVFDVHVFLDAHGIVYNVTRSRSPFTAVYALTDE